VRRADRSGPDLTGRTVVVTGGNSGIGKEAAVVLATMGAQVVVAARNRSKGESALAEINSRSGNDSAELADLDLASTASIRAFADGFLRSHERLDVLLNNAGLTLRKRSETADGFETTFGVNHLGHFLLTALLRDRLVASAPARVVNVASGAHRYARHGLDFDDLMSTKRYRPFITYGRSKLANILFTRELARRLDGTGVTANALHPGFVASNFARDGDTGRLGNIAMVLGSPFAISPAKGAQTSVFLASSPTVEGVTGQYFAKCALATTSAAATDDDAARRLWTVSEQLLR
jgi:NAD(P)-dependent dehydrogenase (short-subunit alcohol dehydrogenase family)